MEILRQLEEYLGMRIIDNFDLVCGVSAGALICGMLGPSGFNIDQCEQSFRTFSKKVFQQSRMTGYSSVLTTHGYYNAQVYEDVLK